MALDALTVAALHFRPGLAVARAQWRVAEAGVLTAGRRPNPVLSVTPQYAANSAAGVSPWVVTSALDWPIETAGKRGLRIDHAEHLAASARLALHAAAWRVRADVRARLLDFAAAEARTARLVAESAVQGEVVTLLEDRLRAGAASVAEVAPARVAALQLATDLADAERQRSEARVRLATAVGVPVRALDGLALVLPLDGDPPVVERPANELRRDTLQGRADVLAALADYAAERVGPPARDRPAVPRSARRPRVRIRPGPQQVGGRRRLARASRARPQPGPDRRGGGAPRRGGCSLHRAASERGRRSRPHDRQPRCGARRPGARRGTLRRRA